MDSTYHCPECNSDQVTSEHHQAFYVNSGDHYCHTTKPQDPNSPAACLASGCAWRGQYSDLKEVAPPPTIAEQLAAAQREIAALKASQAAPATKPVKRRSTRKPSN